MGATNYRPAFPSRAFRELALSLTKGLPLLFMATLALLSCDFFDIFPPEIEIVTPNEGTSYFAALPIELKATDNRRVDKVEVFVNGTSVYEFTKSPYKTDISLDQYSAASVNLKAIAHDQAGNSAEASQDVTVTIGLRLTAPNGGESWPENSTQTITWESSGVVGSTVSLHYSTDGGSTWNEIIGSTANNGTYTWTLPNLTETQTACQVKIASGSYSDASEGDFTIINTNYFTLTSPNGGEIWPERSLQIITWQIVGNVGNLVTLLYSLTGGSSWTQITTSTLNDGAHSWIVPNVSGTIFTCKVKIISETTDEYDISDSNFIISEVPDNEPPSIPTGLIANVISMTEIELTWNASEDNVSVLGYYLFRDGVKIVSINGTTFLDTGLIAGTSYCYSVSAFDDEYNVSNQSTELCATTYFGDKLMYAYTGYPLSGDGEIYFYNGTDHIQLTDNSVNDSNPDFTSDGSKIVYQSYLSGNWDIYIMDIDGSNKTQLTFSTAKDEVPRISPDGERIVFASDRDGDTEIYIMDINGMSQTRLTFSSGIDNVGTWSPDGTKIAFGSERDGQYEIYVMEADGSNQTNLTNSSGDDDIPSWSRDGSKISFVSDRSSSRLELYYMSFNGTNQTRVTFQNEQILFSSWSPSGNQLLFDKATSSGYLNHRLFRIDIDGLNLQQVSAQGFIQLFPVFHPYSVDFN